MMVLSRWILRGGGVSLLFLGVFANGYQSIQKSGVTFEGQIKPILKAHCIECHTGNTAAAKLDLTSRERLISGGLSGNAVIPGKADESLLIQRIQGFGGKERMPLGFAPLQSNEIELIKSWINEGALAGTSTMPASIWSFVQPLKGAVPRIGDSRWAGNPIDAFVFKRLHELGLAPSPTSDKPTLIRRVTLDLTGLPPTPKEVREFVRDPSPQAYERVVDRLLRSPHYGEKMALPWLDAARYADSNGFQQDGDTYQYVWRDWVVRALNSNMPFDQFTVKQLAGDLLPGATKDDVIATAFNRNHMLNGEGGAIPEEQRSVVLFDRVDVTSTTWFGLTMACARCHDHKYDPLSQKDYYSLMAFFNNVPETGVPPGGGQYRIAEPWVYSGTQQQEAQVSRLEGQIHTLESKVSQIVQSKKFEESLAVWIGQCLANDQKLRQAKLEVSPWQECGQFTSKSFEAAFNTEFLTAKTAHPNGRVHAEWADGEVQLLSGENTAYYFQRKVTCSDAFQIALGFGSDDGLKVWWNGKLVHSNKVNRAAIANSDLVTVKTSKGTNTLLIKVVNGGGIGGFVFNLARSGHSVKVTEAINVPADKRTEQTKEILKRAFVADSEDGLAKLTKELESRKLQLSKIQESMARVMVMSDSHPRETHIFSRGNYEVLLDKVEPNVPRILPALPGTAPKNRLTLAHWIVSPTNPLTARVQVNRIWQTFFGTGLVKTSENFGIQGEQPTHPELLDWLAVDFRESGWNLKRLVRLIVTSHTYRQSSKVSRELLEIDPDNRFLARGARFRMPSMILRDVALASSGLLNSEIGGKPVYPYQPKGIWDGLAITKERDFTYPESKGRDLYRRSLYTFWRRTAAPGNMFDSSPRQSCTVRPSKTSTPLHALTTLNDPTWNEASRKLAQNAMLTHPKSINDQISDAFMRVVSRTPNESERAVLRRSFERSLKGFRASPGSAQSYLAVGESAIMSQLDVEQLAALSQVCLAIYNLDEALTRE